MKAFIYIFVIILFNSCSSTRITDSWVNKDYKDYKPKKVLIIGLTNHLSGRTLFEEQLKDELLKRSIDAIESYKVFKPSFTSSKQTETEIEKEIQQLSNDGFDSVLISTVKGVDEKVSYSGDSFKSLYYWKRFGRYYYRVQDVYLQKGYYSKYKVYHIEATLYNLNENNDKSLVWVASYDIVDPQQIQSTVTDYIKAIMKSLEEENLIPKINTNNSY